MKAIESYLAAWNARTSEERTALLQSCLTPDVIYIDPHAPEPIEGIESMQELIEAFRSRFDHRLIAEGRIDEHHSVFRLRWRLQRENGDVLSRGLMVGDIADAEPTVLKRIVQFVDDHQTSD